MHDYDRELYSHFYNDEYSGFVYSIRKCKYCGSAIYNCDSSYCIGGCKTVEIPAHTPRYFDSLTNDDYNALVQLENKWLYDF